MMRATTDMDLDLKNDIKEMADSNNWSFSFMCYTLLQQAVKEKKRNRKGAKKDNSRHNSADMGSSNTE